MSDHLNIWLSFTSRYVNVQLSMFISDHLHIWLSFTSNNVNVQLFLHQTSTSMSQIQKYIKYKNEGTRAKLTFKKIIHYFRQTSSILLFIQFKETTIVQLWLMLLRTTFQNARSTGSNYIVNVVQKWPFNELILPRTTLYLFLIRVFKNNHLWHVWHFVGSDVNQLILFWICGLFKIGRVTFDDSK